MAAMTSALQANGIMDVAAQRLASHARSLVQLEQAEADPEAVMIERIICAEFEVLLEIARRRYLMAVSREVIERR